MKIGNEYETDYWRHVILEYRSDHGRIGESVIHSHQAELENLRDDLLDRIDSLESNQTGMRDDPDFDQQDLKGLPDDTSIPRPYTYRLVALMALSCGIMEKQLEIFLSQDLIPDKRRDGIVQSCFENRGLYENLEFAKAADVIDDKVYSPATDVRKTRNRLVHNPVFRLHIDSYSAHRHRIKKALKAPNEIDQLIQNAV